MGQVVLGFRSLLFKLAIFVIMAALLAWALGGTLFPRASIVDLVPVRIGDIEFFWRIEVGGGTISDRHDGEMWYVLMRRDTTAIPVPVETQPRCADATDLVLIERREIWFGMRASRDLPAWSLVRYDEPPTFTRVETYPNRLALEAQFRRLELGLSIETATEAAQRHAARISPARE